jgi:hypothetical protein
MVKYIIFLEEQEASTLISRINTCMGFPNDIAQTWQIAPDSMCEFDLETGNKLPIGYGVLIKDRIIDCLTTEEQSEVFEIPSNINTCSWDYSGTTISQ